MKQDFDTEAENRRLRVSVNWSIICRCSGTGGHLDAVDALRKSLTISSVTSPFWRRTSATFRIDTAVFRRSLIIPGICFRPRTKRADALSVFRGGWQAAEAYRCRG